ncbi:MAG: methyltransferase domain-containing protein [Gammaproteobacteria bacterium]|nr:methyltransferase domain-containing protein [Gammaproteobacteria bacterium]
MYCWICGNAVARFERYGVPERTGLCPHCGAKPRARALEWLLAEVIGPALGYGDRILEVGPSRFSIDRLNQGRSLRARPWTLIDRRITRAHRRVRSPHRFLRMDVCRLGFSSRSFDLLLCNNILPYVREDRKALSEIARCLKLDGLAIINTHTGPGATLSAAEHRRLHPELDDDFYAANGDQWVYGEDFYDRIADAGLIHRTAWLFGDRPREFLLENGLNPDNRCLFAFLEPSALDRCLHPSLSFSESP